MSNITLQITGEPDAVADFVKRLAEPAPQPAEKPWFGELSAEEAADMEVGFYGLTADRQIHTRLAQNMAEANVVLSHLNSEVEAMVEMMKTRLAEAAA